MSSHEKKVYKGGYKTTDVSSQGTKTERVYKYPKTILGTSRLVSKKVTKR